MAPLSTKTQQTRKEKEEEKIQPLLLSFLSNQWTVILLSLRFKSSKKVVSSLISTSNEPSTAIQLNIEAGADFTEGILLNPCHAVTH